jgi:hydroxyacylglutathione hydrolase
MFGLSYRELDLDGRSFVFPATTPVQFDPEAFHHSIERLMSLAPKAAYLTHYGRITDLERLAADLLRLVDLHAAIANAVPGGAAHPDCHLLLSKQIEQLVRREAIEQPWGVSAERAVELLAMDIDLNAQGLISWLESRKKM